MKSIISFLSYNNSVPLLVLVVFLGAGGALAATNDGILSSTQTVRSVDNTYIVGADIDLMPFAVRVNTASEDDSQYYVQYTIDTLGVVDDVWQPVTEPRLLAVDKAALRGRDLGLYVEKELSEVRDYERQKMRETKAIEARKGESQKVVATTYSGLIGAMMTGTEETFPSYQPVVTEMAAPGVLPIDISELKPSPTFDANAAPVIVEPDPLPPQTPTIPTAPVEIPVPIEQLPTEATTDTPSTQEGATTTASEPANEASATISEPPSNATSTPSN